MKCMSAARWDCETGERPQLFALPFVLSLLFKDEQPESRSFKDLSVVAGHCSNCRS